MQLVEGGRIVEDRYLRMADDAPVADDKPVIVSAERLLADPTALAGRSAPTGVVWPNNRPVGELVPYLSQLALVALVFPVFRDGRAYSQARLLRERHGFRGTLRATGNVLRDQFLFMVRAGFDSFEVTKEADAQAFTESIARYDVFYQPTADGRETAQHARHDVFYQPTADGRETAQHARHDHDQSARPGQSGDPEQPTSALPLAPGLPLARE